MIKKILLVNPPFSMQARYGKGIKKMGAVLPPLGLLYLAAVLENNKYTVNVLDTQINGINIGKTVKECENNSPDIIGIYCNTSNFNSCKELTERIKEKMDICIVLGGPHPSIDSEGTLKHESIDYVVVGEGEETIVELIGALNKKLSLKKIKGIGYKKKGKIFINPRREFIKDISKLPFPARHLVPLNRYAPSPNHYKRLPMTTMLASRGCPFGCTFCSSRSIWGRNYRARPVEDVIKEIEFLIKKYKIKEIGFWDDLWGADKKWVGEFCDKIIKRGIDISWSCECRVDTIDKQTLNKMKQAGCWCIFYGFESLDQEVLDVINKKVKVADIENTIRWTKEAGIEIRANFIIGLPKDTPSKIKKMVKRLTKLNPDYVKFNIFTPYPGTEVYAEIKNGKWGTMSEEYNKLTGYFATFRPHGYKSLEEVKKTRDYAFRKFYLRPAFIISRLINIKSFSDIKRYYKGFKSIISI